MSNSRKNSSGGEGSLDILLGRVAFIENKVNQMTSKTGPFAAAGQQLEATQEVLKSYQQLNTHTQQMDERVDSMEKKLQYVVQQASILSSRPAGAQAGGGVNEQSVQKVLENTKDSLMSEISSVREHKSSIVETCVESVGSIGSRVNDLQDEFDQFRRGVAAKDQDISGLQKRIDELESQCAALVTDNREMAESEMNRLRSQASAIHQDLKAAVGEEASRRLQLEEEVLRSINDVGNRADSVLQRYLGLEENVASKIQVESKSRRENSEQLSETLSSLREELTETTRVLREEAEKRFATSRNALEERLESAVGQLKEPIRVLRQENDAQLTAMTEQIQDQADKQAAERASLLSQMEAMEKRVATADSDRGKFVEKVDATVAASSDHIMHLRTSLPRSIQDSREKAISECKEYTDASLEAERVRIRKIENAIEGEEGERASLRNLVESLVNQEQERRGIVVEQLRKEMGARLDSLEQENAELRRTHEEGRLNAREKMEHLAKALTDCDTRLESMVRSCENTLNDNLKVLNARAESMESSIAKEQDNMAAIEARLQGLESTVQGSNAEISRRMTEEYTSLSESLKSVSSTLEEMQSSIAEKNSAIRSDFSSQVAEVHKKADAISAELREAIAAAEQTMTKTTSTELNVLRSEIRSLEGQVQNTSSGSNEATTQRIEALDRALNDIRQGTRSKLESVHATLREDMSKFISRTDERWQQEDTKRSEYKKILESFVNEQKGALSFTSSAVKELMSRVETQKEKLSEAEKEFEESLRKKREEKSRYLELQTRVLRKIEDMKAIVDAEANNRSEFESRVNITLASEKSALTEYKDEVSLIVEDFKTQTAKRLEGDRSNTETLLDNERQLRVEALEQYMQRVEAYLRDAKKDVAGMVDDGVGSIQRGVDDLKKWRESTTDGLASLKETTEATATQIKSTYDLQLSDMSQRITDAGVALEEKLTAVVLDETDKTRGRVKEDVASVRVEVQTSLEKIDRDVAVLADSVKNEAGARSLSIEEAILTCQMNIENAMEPMRTSLEGFKTEVGSRLGESGEGSVVEEAKGRMQTILSEELEKIRTEMASLRGGSSSSISALEKQVAEAVANADTTNEAQHSLSEQLRADIEECKSSQRQLVQDMIPEINASNIDEVAKLKATFNDLSASVFAVGQDIKNERADRLKSEAAALQEISEAKESLENINRDFAGQLHSKVCGLSRLLDETQAAFKEHRESGDAATAYIKAEVLAVKKDVQVGIDTVRTEAAAAQTKAVTTAIDEEIARVDELMANVKTELGKQVDGAIEIAAEKSVQHINEGIEKVTSKITSAGAEQQAALTRVKTELTESLESSIAELSKKNNTLNIGMDSLNQHMTKLEEGFNGLQNDVHSLKSVSSEMSARVDDGLSRTSVLEEKVQVLDAEHATAKALAEVKSDVDAAKARLEDAVKDLQSDMEVDRLDVSSQVSEIKESIDTFVNKLSKESSEGLDVVNMDLLKRLSVVAEDVKGLKEALESAGSENKQSSAELAKMCDAIKSKTKSLHNDVGTLRKQVEEQKPDNIARAVVVEEMKKARKETSETIDGMKKVMYARFSDIESTAVDNKNRLDEKITNVNVNTESVRKELKESQDLLLGQIAYMREKNEVDLQQRVKDKDSILAQVNGIVSRSREEFRTEADTLDKKVADAHKSISMSEKRVNERLDAQHDAAEKSNKAHTEATDRLRVALTSHEQGSLERESSFRAEVEVQFGVIKTDFQRVGKSIAAELQGDRDSRFDAIMEQVNTVQTRQDAFEERSKDIQEQMDAAVTKTERAVEKATYVVDGAVADLRADVDKSLHEFRDSNDAILTKQDDKVAQLRELVEEKLSTARTELRGALDVFTSQSSENQISFKNELSRRVETIEAIVQESNVSRTTAENDIREMVAAFSRTREACDSATREELERSLTLAETKLREEVSSIGRQMDEVRSLKEAESSHLSQSIQACESRLNTFEQSHECNISTLQRQLGEERSAREKWEDACTKRLDDDKTDEKINALATKISAAVAEMNTLDASVRDARVITENRVAMMQEEIEAAAQAAVRAHKQFVEEAQSGVELQNKEIARVQRTVLETTKSLEELVANSDESNAKSFKQLRDDVTRWLRDYEGSGSETAVIADASEGVKERIETIEGDLERKIGLVKARVDEEVQRRIEDYKNIVDKLAAEETARLATQERLEEVANFQSHEENILSRMSRMEKVFDEDSHRREEFKNNVESFVEEIQNTQTKMEQELSNFGKGERERAAQRDRSTVQREKELRLAIQKAAELSKQHCDEVTESVENRMSMMDSKFERFETSAKQREESIMDIVKWEQRERLSAFESQQQSGRSLQDEISKLKVAATSVTCSLNEQGEALDAFKQTVQKQVDDVVYFMFKRLEWEKIRGVETDGNVALVRAQLARLEEITGSLVTGRSLNEIRIVTDDTLHRWYEHHDVDEVDLAVRDVLMRLRWPQRIELDRLSPGKYMADTEITVEIHDANPVVRVSDSAYVGLSTYLLRMVSPVLTQGLPVRGDVADSFEPVVPISSNAIPKQDIKTKRVSTPQFSENAEPVFHKTGESLLRTFQERRNSTATSKTTSTTTTSTSPQRSTTQYITNKRALSAMDMNALPTSITSAEKVFSNLGNQQLNRKGENKTPAKLPEVSHTAPNTRPGSANSSASGNTAATAPGGATLPSLSRARSIYKEFWNLKNKVESK